MNNILTSSTTPLGKRAMIPIMMIREIPLPIPFSVIFSPSHMIKMVPQVKVIMDELQPEVDLTDAIKEAKKRATRNLPKSTGRDDG